MSIFIIEFASMQHPSISKRMECVNCGWRIDAGRDPNYLVRDLLDDLRAAKAHVCPVDKRTIGIRDWRAIARDAFLDERDAEAIAIIAEMEPDRLRVNYQVRVALAEALTELERHNHDYHHVTAVADIERWKKIGDLK